MKLSNLFASTLVTALFACSAPAPSETTAPASKPIMAPASLMQLQLPVSLTIDSEGNDLAAKRCVCTATGHSWSNCVQPNCNNLCLHSGQGPGICR